MHCLLKLYHGCNMLVDIQHLNIGCLFHHYGPEFIWGNINTWLHSQLFIWNRSLWKENDLFILLKLITWMLMTWGCKEPGHQQPCGIDITIYFHISFVLSIDTAMAVEAYQRKGKKLPPLITNYLLINLTWSGLSPENPHSTAHF